MPLVRIDIPATTPPDHREAIIGVVYDALVKVASAPDNDKFMIISEHGPGSLVMDPNYVVARSDRALIIQITLNAGRTIEVKKNLYARSRTGSKRASGCPPRTCSSTWSRCQRKTGPSGAARPSTPTDERAAFAGYSL